MPQLKSGRHVGLTVEPYLDAIKSGDENLSYFGIVTFRLNVPSPDQLRDHVAIVYYRDGGPPNGSAYISGYCIADVLSGTSDFSAAEVEEFREWLDDNSQLGPWLSTEFAEINQAIAGSPVWESALLSDDGASALKRVVLERSALEPMSMAMLRNARCK